MAASHFARGRRWARLRRQGRVGRRFFVWDIETCGFDVDINRQVVVAVDPAGEDRTVISFFDAAGVTLYPYQQALYESLSRCGSQRAIIQPPRLSSRNYLRAIGLDF